MISARAVHRFVRNPNIESSVYERVGSRYFYFLLKKSIQKKRFNPQKNTLTVLQDPKNDRTLYLLGTTNSSTFLSYRTKELIAQEKPDSLFVQTNKEWWNMAKNVQNVKCQQELNLYNASFKKAFNWNLDNSIRNIIFKSKFYSWLLVINWFKATPNDFHPFVPGLEMKFAIEEAQKLQIPVTLGGLAIDDVSIQALKNEPRMDPLSQLYYGFTCLHNSFWKREHYDNYNVLDVQGGETFAESLDRYRLNWFVKYFEKLAPYQKKILIDQKDEDIFYTLYRNMPGKKIFAVVNQWHMPGIENYWKSATNTNDELQPINPIGDFDINQYMETQLVNDTLRAFVSKLGKTEPATWKNYITIYHKDNYEAERVRHVQFQGHDDPHIYHGLPQDYDDDMKPKHHDSH
ncbi:hypothetical protein IMG5_099690 [Ichthyophthirius multifiliis]|uniref:TraB family protein n=1 Tax=Ichthyophthirius multifiliis TaxID=5932 RepID=G0QS76_ICHMU|nr:hypothetical protein IMG5_099690 [Ichthyophthirius multifiliis]EGR31941.1 hypothetical protein IMG5_099690 [Ichthyophthirius multifiliis]|eukprot:XP_004035427.1 hypothetical protein IMG5_099690 [Ichthyophthirius multifiliis]